MLVRPPRNLGSRQTDTTLAALEQEVFQEKAATLGRLTQAFEHALSALREFDALGSEKAGADADRREQLLEAAADALWCFVVQREACGLRNTEAVLREYRVAPELRLRMGVSQRRKPAERPRS